MAKEIGRTELTERSEVVSSGRIVVEFPILSLEFCYSTYRRSDLVRLSNTSPITIITLTFTSFETTTIVIRASLAQSH